MRKPLLICMTPVRNEAWVLNAFLKATSLWVDYIIIADQNSTDGSREIALSYPKVILIDNNNPDFNEAERQKLLIDRARQIEGDKILFGLDADEIFSANFTQTQDWQKILSSVPGDVFWFQWANIYSNQKEYWSPETFYPWMFHDDGIEPHGNYVRNMHSMRIPYPIDEKQMFYVNDFKVMHLAYLNKARVASKRRFYQFVDWEMNHRNSIALSRTNAQIKNENSIYELPSNNIYIKPFFDFNLFECVDISTIYFWFDRYICERLNNYDMKEIRNLNIWDKEFLKEYNIKDPRTFWNKFVHLYLHYSEKISKFIFIRLIDRVLKYID